jgi:hypothetical protein
MRIKKGKTCMQENKNPLLPDDALEYFKDSSNLSYKNYFRAISLRSCLENIVETVFIYIASNTENRNMWLKKSLSQKIKTLESYFPKDIITSLHKIRKIGNTGAHQSNHHELDETEINSALDDISKVCEWTIISYFKKYGFNVNSWVPTILSTLPPVYRVRILEELFSYHEENLDSKSNLIEHLSIAQQQWHRDVSNAIISSFEPATIPEEENKYPEIFLIIDKLSMAYLKNGSYEKGVEFIDQCFEKEIINDWFSYEMKDKLEMLNNEISNLPISRNLQDTKDIFKKILAEVEENEYSLFMTLFTAVVAQNELKNFPHL